MARSTRVVVTKKRDVRTYAELWHASHCVLTSGQENPKGSSWQFLSSTLLTAFAFEAYLNHVGPTLFVHWSHLDRLPPWSKLELICEKLAVSFPRGSGSRPLQSVAKLLDFRNTIAHGRSHQLEAKPVIRTAENYEAALGERLLFNWEKLIQSDVFPRRAREDVTKVLEAIHEARVERRKVFSRLA